MEIASKKPKKKQVLMGQLIKKRLSSENTWPSPESKREKLVSPIKQLHSCNQFSSSHANSQLKLRDEEQEADVDLEEAPMRILSWNIRGLGKP